mmetsp:Transcript_71320/g.170777  ORF Transcript_71320/g.170777 Transcript_71320/m.170777 type:complete len:122 (-) Transcript_71320:61-426(-)
MISNIPHHVRQSDIRRRLEETGFGELYDFLYLPHAFHTRSNLGYAFINFPSLEHAAAFETAWGGMDQLQNPRPNRPLLIQPAATQGIDELLSLCMKRKLYRFRNPSFRPFVRDVHRLPIVL